MELLAKIDTTTPVTLINHQTGSVVETLTATTGIRNHEYKGSYDFTSLVASPSWNSTDNYINKVASITAITGVPFSEIQITYPVELTNQNRADQFDERIRKKALLDSALKSMGNTSDGVKYYQKVLTDQTPQLYGIQFGSAEIILISYQFPVGQGPKLLSVDDKITPLIGSCAAFPLFYSIGEHLYFRLLTSLCNTGYIINGNYIVFGDTVKLEWATTAYAN